MQSARSGIVGSLIALAMLLQAAHGGTRAAAAEPLVPIAVAPGERLGERDDVLLANRAGSVMRVDLSARRVVETLSVGKRLADLATLDAGRRALVADESAHELILLDASPGRLRVTARLSLGPHPVAVRVAMDGRVAFVSTLWSRQLVAVELSAIDAARPELKIAWQVALPFAPRKLLLLPGEQHLLVADSFGGGLALVDVAARRLAFAGGIPGHNVRGLALSPDGRQVVVAHQRLDETLATGLGELRSGRLTGAVLRSLDAATLRANPLKALEASTVRELGFVGQGAADPGEIAWDAEGQRIVALSGNDELAIDSGGSEFARVPTGRHPTAVIASRDGRHIIAVNTFSDSLTIINPVTRRAVAQIELAPPIPAAQLHPRDRGERLFRDAKLSEEGWMSCHSCHTDGHTNGRLADNFGDETFGTPKRTLSLLGTVNTGPWGWRGKNQDLYDTIERSVQSTLHGSAMDRRDSSDLATFLLSLAPAPPLAPAQTPADRALVDAGRQSFEQLGCIKCHIPPLTYSAFEAVDVGLEDETRERKFNPPSLRGVGHGPAFFHDNRAKSLEEVFTRHAHQLESELAPQELQALVRYLRSL